MSLPLATNDLVEAFEASSRLLRREVDQLQRYLREAGMIPPSGRGRTSPQNAPVHAAVLIASALVEAPALRVAEVLPRLWAAEGYGPLIRYWRFAADPRDLPKGGTRATFGQVLELLIRAPYHPDPTERSAFLAKFEGVEVQPERSRSILRFSDRSEEFAFPGSSKPRPGSGRSGITVTRFAAADVFLALAEVVEASRQAAIEQGVEIPTEATYAALKASPPKIEGLA